MLKSLVTHTKSCEPTTYTGSKGELTVDTDTGILYIHDGVTAGGIAINAGIQADAIIEALGYIPLDSTDVGAQHGVAALDAVGLIVMSQLPPQVLAAAQSMNVSNSSTTTPIIDGGFF